jgi:hypothetical protein
MESDYAWGLMTVIIAMGSIIVNLLLLRACQKMYTEYFKDRSMGNRTNKED